MNWIEFRELGIFHGVEDYSYWAWNLIQEGYFKLNLRKTSIEIWREHGDYFRTINFRNWTSLIQLRKSYFNTGSLCTIWLFIDIFSLKSLNSKYFTVLGFFYFQKYLILKETPHLTPYTTRVINRTAILKNQSKQHISL